MLELSGVAVDIEDATAEEVAEEGREGLPLGKVVKLGLEHVLYVVGVGSDHVAKDMDMDGPNR